MVAYPDDISQRIRRLEQIVDRLFTAINTQPAQVQVGPDGSARMVMAIAADGLPEIRCYPDGGTGYARIIAGAAGGVGLEIVSEANVSGNRYSMLIDQEDFKVFYTDAAGTQAQGTMLQATTTSGSTGFLGTASSEQNYWHYQSDRTTHVGMWDNGGAGTYWGLVTGSGSTSGTFATLTYPVTMASSMNPIVGFQSTAANFNWCITANSTTGFTVSRSTSGSIDLYYWVFRTP